MSEMFAVVVIFTLENGNKDRRIAHIGPRAECERVYEELTLANYDGPVRAIGAQVLLAQWIVDPAVIPAGGRPKSCLN